MKFKEVKKTDNLCDVLRWFANGGWARHADISYRIKNNMVIDQYGDERDHEDILSCAYKHKYTLLEEVIEPQKCPFCLSDYFYVYVENDYYYIKCSNVNCGAQGPHTQGKKSSVILWNSIKIDDN